MLRTNDVSPSKLQRPIFKPPPTVPPPIVCARLLGHLLRLAPAGNGRESVQRGITSAVDDATLMKLARHYLINILNACKSQPSIPLPYWSVHS